MCLGWKLSRDKFDSIAFKIKSEQSILKKPHAINNEFKLK